MLCGSVLIHQSRFADACRSKEALVVQISTLGAGLLAATATLLPGAFSSDTSAGGFVHSRALSQNRGFGAPPRCCIL